MKTFQLLVAGTCSLALAIDTTAGQNTSKPNGPQLVAQDGAAPQLGEPVEFEPPPTPAIPGEPAGEIVPKRVPPAPSPAAQPQPGSAPPAPPQPAAAPNPNPQANGARQGEAVAASAQAQELIDDGRYDEAIRHASRAIALDSANAAAYKTVRAAAYLSLGRYEEALADASPLEVTVTSPRAELKTKQTVLGVVSSGTKVIVDDVNGNWLKVVSVGDTHYDWAWIHQRDVKSPARMAPRVVEYDLPSYQVEPPDGLGRIYIYGPVGPHETRNYGRDYYDYWHHVPQQYWQFLPQ